MRFNPAYPAMLAHDWKKKGQPDPTGWWASEKYDGLRALWDGENFYSRNGKIFHAPQWFKDTLPNTPLDGELWRERSVAGFQQAVSTVRKKVGGKDWEKITYMVFDIPTSTEPFEKVQAKLKRMNLGEYAEVAPQHKVRSQADMMKRYEAALSEGAEGLMLRKPGSRYAATRSASLLKVKPKDTAEAVVTGYQGGTGKHQGRMGALKVYLLGDKSKKFKVGTGFKDHQREDPPPIGAIIEIKFNDYTAAGLPRFPAFLRVRTDMMADRPKRKPKAAKPARKKTMAKRKLSGQNARFRYEEGDMIAFQGKHGIIRGMSRETGPRGGPKLPTYFVDEIRIVYGKIGSGRWASHYQRTGIDAIIPQHLVDGISEHDALPSDLQNLMALYSRALKPKAPAKRKAAPKKRTPKKRTPKPKRKAPSKAKRTPKHYFNMSKNDLVSLGDAGAKKELKRRGRDAKGNKIR